MFVATLTKTADSPQLTALVALSEDRKHLLLQTVRVTCLSKFPLGKVEMWQV